MKRRRSVIGGGGRSAPGITAWQNFFFFLVQKKKKRFTVDLSETKEAGSVMKSARVGPTRGHFLLLQRPGEGEVKHLWHAALLVQRQLSASLPPLLLLSELPLWLCWDSGAQLAETLASKEIRKRGFFSP